jgi:superfamily I DNA/RNA helicase
MAHNLDPNQQKAVETDGNILVSACPGSGKTRVLSFRAVRLLSNNSTVVTVSFTQDSANGLVDRIRGLMPKGIRPGALEAGTFHSLALQQLRRSGLIKEQEILRTHDWILMIRQAIFAVERDTDFEFADNPEEETRIAIEHYAAHAIDPLGIKPTNAAEQAAMEFTRLKRQHQRYDFGDMLMLAVQGMENGTVKPYPHKDMLVDEFQDADSAQYKWLMAHHKAGTHITVVGDDDQAIYSWRHASGYAGMMNFLNETKATHITLPTNYRCAADILDHSARLIQRNNDRVDKRLTAFQTERGVIKPLRIHGDDDLVEKIKEQRNRIDSHGKTIAVIARTNAILKKLAVIMATESIPFELMSGGGIANTPEIQMLLNLCEAPNEMAPSKSIPRIANTLRWLGFPEEIISESEKQGNRSPELFVDHLRNEQWNKLPFKWQQTAVESLASNLSNWIKNAKRQNDELVIMSVGHWFGKTADTKMRHQWEEKPGKRESPPRPSRIIVPIAGIMSGAKGSMKQKIAFIQRLGTAKEEGNEEDNWTSIKLMTMHKSKGLEFDYVWIANAERKVCPLENANTDILTPEIIAEERRLFYVAMTRAKKELTITYAEDDKRQPSIFIAEAGIVT